MRVLTDHPLGALNTFGLDVRCRFFCEIATEAELRELLAQRDLCENGLLVLGGGSNMLFLGDFPGLVLKPAIRGIERSHDTSEAVQLRAGAGENWHELVSSCVEQDLGGIEALALIPGTVGAAPIQNIGAYGSEVCESVVSVEAVEIASGQRLTFTNDACRFGYRDSVFKHEWSGRLVVTRVTFRLEKNPKPKAGYAGLDEELPRICPGAPSVRDVCQAVMNLRRAKLPDPAVLGNAGSFFKNPEIGAAQLQELKARFPDLISFPTGPDRSKLAAGWLIERAGWKGRRLGACGVHDRQALVLVNHGGATGQEILDLSERIRQSVLEMFRVELEREVVVVPSRDGAV